MVTWVKTGTVDVTNGSTTVIGHGTMFVDEFREGDGFVGPDDRLYEVLNLVSNTQMTLGKGYNGITENGRPYAVIPIQGYLQRTADMLRELTLEAGETISSPNVSALAQAIAAANGVLYFTTSTTMATAPSQAFGRGLLNLADAVALRNAAGLEPSQTYGRGLLNLADAASGRAALGLGTAATAVLTTSTSDTTVGRVLRVGDHGLGAYAIAVTGANVDSAATTGFYFVTSAGPSLPVQALGYLLVHAQSATYCTQVFFTENGAQAWQRSKVNNVWGGWSKQVRVGDFGIGGYGTLVTSDTINTLVASGFYYCNSVSGVNLPVSVNGFLLVHAQGALYCKQIFSHVTDGRTWERYLVNGVWGNWDQVLKASQLASSNGDTTPGKVLTVGYMGIGARTAYPASSANTALFNGFYQGAGASSTDYPSVNTGYGNLLVMSGATNYLTQISTFAAGTGIALSEMHFRGSNNNGATWAPWAKVFHSGNAVGLVSQASGLPTGAIIEQGSNGNGSYTKFADGTAILRVGTSTATIAANSAVGTNVVYPITLSAASPIIPAATCEPNTSWDHSGIIGCSAVGVSNMSIVVKNGATPQTFTLRWQVTGRWF